MIFYFTQWTEIVILNLYRPLGATWCYHYSSKLKAEMVVRGVFYLSLMLILPCLQTLQLDKQSSNPFYQCDAEKIRRTKTLLGITELFPACYRVPLMISCFSKCTLCPFVPSQSRNRDLKNLPTPRNQLLVLLQPEKSVK